MQLLKHDYHLSQTVLGPCHALIVLHVIFRQILDYISSPAIVIPLLVLLVLVIFYQISLAGSLRESNNDLRTQLRRERTEERRKMFKMADSKTKEPEKPFDKWSRLLEGTFNKAQSADQASKKPERTPKEKEERAKGMFGVFLRAFGCFVIL